MAKTRFVYDGKKHLEAEFGGFIPYFCGFLNRTYLKNDL
jgi:hypothetical protein